MPYIITIDRAARKALKSIPVTYEQRIRAAIQALAYEPRPPGCLKLKGSEQWRIRESGYRMIYEINDKALIVVVVEVSKRDKAYS